MFLHSKNFAAIIFMICAALGALSENVRAIQKEEAKITNLRRLFKAATGNGFEIVKDEVKGNDSSHTGGRYWLAHVKPKRSGSYVLKYTYKYDKFSRSSSEESEHTLTLNVGGKICYRYNNVGSGVSSYCLGDTIIIPIRLDYASGHVFSFKSRSQNAESLEESQKYQKSFIRFSEVEQINNPLRANLKLLGIQRNTSPNRACCDERISYYAIFEAVGAGRFNLSLSSLRGDETPGAKMKPVRGGMPVIIVNPGTPITALLFKEDTIDYSDNKRFSAHAGNSFITDLMIIQPGDVFAVQYSEHTESYKIGDMKKKESPEIKPVIDKLPFAIDRKRSFNDWIANYLPKEK